MKFSVPVILGVHVCLALSRTVTAGNVDATDMPHIGLGTAGLGTRTKEVVLKSLESGVRMIDSAQASEWYSEGGAGEALQEFCRQNPNSDHIYVVTKVHPRSFAFDKMSEKISESKQLLLGESGIDRSIDAVLLHAPHCWRGHCTPEEEAVGWRTAWQNLVKLQSIHNIGMIGVSNFHSNYLTEMKANPDTFSKLSIIQNWMDPFNQDRETRAFAAEHNIRYQAYSSFGTQWGNSARLRNMNGGANVNPVLTSEVLKRIAEKHGASVTKVVLAWVMKEGAVPLPRSSRLEHIEENFSFLKISQSSLNNGEVEVEGKIILKKEDGATAVPLPVQLDEQDMADIRALDGSIGTPWD